MVISALQRWGRGIWTKIVLLNFRMGPIKCQTNVDFADPLPPKTYPDEVRPPSWRDWSLVINGCPQNFFRGPIFVFLEVNTDQKTFKGTQAQISRGTLPLDPHEMMYTNLKIIIHGIPISMMGSQKIQSYSDFN